MADHAASSSEAGVDPATSELGSGEEQTADLKIILAGDSAVGKSKLIERFLMDDFHPKQVRALCPDQQHCVGHGDGCSSELLF